MTAMQSETIESSRERINDLDEEIALLLIKRRRLSQSIQRMKIHDKQALVDLSREREVIAHYRVWLGPEGVEFAHQVLHFSKKAQVH